MSLFWWILESSWKARLKGGEGQTVLYQLFRGDMYISLSFHSLPKQQWAQELNMKAVVRLKPLVSICGCYMMHYCMSCAEDKNTIKLTLMANWCFASVLWITWEAWYDLQTFCIFTIHNMCSSTGQCFTSGGVHCVVCPDCTNETHKA